MPTEAADDALHDSLCQTLRTFYDEQTSAGRSHPFLTEALADYTDDSAEAVRLYELALEQAGAFPDEPTHTKMISLPTDCYGSWRPDIRCICSPAVLVALIALAVLWSVTHTS